MLQVHYPNILAFIEGTMEKLFVNQNFHYVQVVKIENGAGWSVEMLADQIVNKYSILDRNPNYVVVWFDREDKLESSLEIDEIVRGRLCELGIEDEKILICVADRTTENVILADEELIRSEIGGEDYQYAGDGKNGKSLMKQLYKTSGKNYKETFHGTKLLKKMRLSRSSDKSPSAKVFIDNCNMECWWF